MKEEGTYRSMPPLQLLRGGDGQSASRPSPFFAPLFFSIIVISIHWLRACLRLPPPRVTAPLPLPQASRSIFVRGSTYNGKGPGPGQICRRGPNLCSTLPAVSGAGERLLCAKTVSCCPVNQTKKRGTCYAALSLRFEARSSPCKHPRCRLVPCRLDLSVSCHRWRMDSVSLPSLDI
ncbi:hypothetical protein HDV63DRAFT_333650 [Trichoderma sp. SZMC 28014]